MCPAPSEKGHRGCETPNIISSYLFLPCPVKPQVLKICDLQVHPAQPTGPWIVCSEWSPQDQGSVRFAQFTDFIGRRAQFLSQYHYPAHADLH